ncbi:hypothetical protein [Tsukamurella soli]|uniref:AAT family amino acid transporter n=1 Tax=Tsukamurella soli TaxID=644556 RepID=A0ABP8JF84_9ACTN
MTTTGITAAETPTRALPRWAVFGVANLAVVAVLAVASWYLLADPTTSPWHLYPLPFNAALFWAILFVVFVGFVCEFVGFDRLPQPARGLALLASTAVFGIVATWVLAQGLGRIAPDFAASRPGGLGYFSGALFVLFGFGTWVMSVLNWRHWPWPQLGLRQPLAGLCEIVAVAIPTIVLYLVIGLPAFSVHVRNPLMAGDTVLGWFYSIVVAVLITGQLLDDQPWQMLGRGRPGRVASVSTIGNIALGTVLYFVFVQLTHLLVGARAAGDLGVGIHQFPAQLGVCWAFWMIFWANAFENRPTSLGTIANAAIRLALTFVLAVATFELYYRFGARRILHEPAVAAGLSGNALGFLDWAVLWTLFYVVGFQSYGLGRWAPAGTAD